MKTRIEKVTSHIEDQLGVARGSISADMSIVDDLGADSLDMVEIIMSLEEEFDIEVSDADAEKVVTVGDLDRLLDKYNVAP